MKNKRKAARLSCGVPITGQKGGVFECSKTVDISQGGLGLISDRKISLKKQIAIELDIDEKEDPLLIKGEVRWVSPIMEQSLYRIGISFKRNLARTRALLKQYST